MFYKPDSDTRNQHSLLSKKRSFSLHDIQYSDITKNELVNKTSSMHTTIVNRKGAENEREILNDTNKGNNFVNRRRVKSAGRRGSYKELQVLAKPLFQQDELGIVAADQALSKQKEMSGINNENKLAKGANPSNISNGIKAKLMKQLVLKRRYFMNLRMTAIEQQNKLITQLAAIKVLEGHVGQLSTPEQLPEVRIVAVPGWPAHDIMLLIHDGQSTLDFDSQFAPHTLVMMFTQLNSIPTEMRSVGETIIRQFMDIFTQLKTETALMNDKALDDKYSEVFETEAEKLKTLVASTVECIQTKINNVLRIAKSAWLDRDNLIQKYDKKQEEILALKSELENKFGERESNTKLSNNMETSNTIMQNLTMEMRKEKIARKAKKQLTESSAEITMKAARSRIKLLERQLKDKNDILNNQNKQPNAQTFKTRAKKLVSSVSLRQGTPSRMGANNKILEEAMVAARLANSELENQMEQNAILKEKLEEAEKALLAIELKHSPLLETVRNLEQQLNMLRERSAKLVDAERQIFLDAVPTKENEPSAKETELWKELQVTREALAKTEDDLHHYKNEKTKLLDKYGSMLQANEGSGENGTSETLAAELISKEKQIMKLHQVIDKQRENEKKMQKSVKEFKSKICDMQVEIKRLRNYDCYTKEESYPELQTELIELQMKISSLKRERAILVNTAASQALNLERHERAANKFAKITRARRDLSAFIMTSNKSSTDITQQDSARSLTAIESVTSTSSATWLALRDERAKMRLMVHGLIFNYTNMLKPKSNKLCILKTEQST